MLSVLCMLGDGRHMGDDAEPLLKIGICSYINAFCRVFVFAALRRVVCIVIKDAQFA